MLTPDERRIWTAAQEAVDEIAERFSLPRQRVIAIISVAIAVKATDEPGGQAASIDGIAELALGMSAEYLDRLKQPKPAPPVQRTGDAVLHFPSPSDDAA